MKKDQHRAETKAVRGGTDLHKKNGPLATPIYQTSTFEVTDNDAQLAATHTDMFYTRYGNPTHTVVQAAIAELEGTDRALLFPSGMSAVTTSHAGAAQVGRPHRCATRYLWWGHEVSGAVAAQARDRDHVGRYHRLRTAPAGDSGEYEAAVPGVAHQSDSEGRGFEEGGSDCARARADQHDRQHVCDADQLPARRVWDRSRDAFWDQIFRRALGFDLRSPGRAGRPAGDRSTPPARRLAGTWIRTRRGCCCAGSGRWRCGWIGKMRMG